MKRVLYDGFSTPGLWTLDNDELQSQTISSTLRRINYVIQLDLAIFAAWLCSEVGLTTFDVAVRFAPFAQRAFGASALTNPRDSHPLLFTTEESPDRH